MSYKEDLEHPKWQKKRLQILERDGWRCVACGANDIQLHAHHTVYTKGAKPWEYDDDILVTLCKHCHHNAHWIDRIEVEVMGIVLPWITQDNDKDFPYCFPCMWMGVIRKASNPNKYDDDLEVKSLITGKIGYFTRGESALYKKPPEVTKAKLHEWIAECQMDLFNEWEEERKRQEKERDRSPAYAEHRRFLDEKNTEDLF
jgi:hypothetical protein